ncbi:MAG: penicillin-binding protein 2 [Candidatus Aminicenantes bacterium]|nr:MAG: penicillin-binding protein 2 [Candidatus Aminicenantes bacterium]
MKSYHQKKTKKRTYFLAFFFILWMGVLVLRLVQLQVIDHVKLNAEAIQQNRNIKKIEPKRGSIFDRNMTILARSVPRYSVFFHPLENESHSEQWSRTKKIGQTLRLPSSKLSTIRAQINKDAKFIWLARKIEEQKATQVLNMNTNGVYLMEENKRFYPQGKRASHVLGRVNIDEIGVSGIEYKYNTILQGVEGEGLILRDAKRRRYSFETLKPPVNGKDLVLTLDETIQYVAEKELKKAVLESQAEWGVVIISDPSTGDILAMTNYPTYDLNHLPDPPTKLDRNKAVHHTYDPGSTFKIVTLSAALENRSVSFEETFDCTPGYVVYAGNTFWDHERLGILDFPEVFIHSSNVGTIFIGQRVGEENLFRAIKKFGFGQRTGIDLPAEEKGLLNPLERWTKISVASHSIGYEISVTPIQMLQSLNIIANQGVIVPPRTVKKINDTDAEMESVSPMAYKRAISDETSANVRDILLGVVASGTGVTARIPGYTIYGKTGTAQKYDRDEKQYLTTAHIASFAGVVENEGPLFSMIVVIDDPKGDYYGSQVAAPVFREIAKKILRYLCVPPVKKSFDTLIASKAGRHTGE